MPQRWSETEDAEAINRISATVDNVAHMCRSLDRKWPESVDGQRLSASLVISMFKRAALALSALLLCAGLSDADIALSCSSLAGTEQG